VDTKYREVKYGDTLWSICNRDEEIPIWLLTKYNPEINLQALKIKTRLIIPVIAPKNNGNKWTWVRFAHNGNDGILEYWNNGVVERRNYGMVENWNVGVRAIKIHWMKSYLPNRSSFVSFEVIRLILSNHSRLHNVARLILRIPHLLSVLLGENRNKRNGIHRMTRERYSDSSNILLCCADSNLQQYFARCCGQSR